MPGKTQKNSKYRYFENMFGWNVWFDYIHYTSAQEKIAINQLRMKRADSVSPILNFNLISKSFWIICWTFIHSKLSHLKLWYVQNLFQCWQHFFGNRLPFQFALPLSQQYILDFLISLFTRSRSNSKDLIMPEVRCFVSICSRRTVLFSTLCEHLN